MKRLILLCTATSIAGLVINAHSQSAPILTDANWQSLGGIPGATGPVNATAIDSSGNVYIGGTFFVVGDVVANYIAKWDGTNWSPLAKEIRGAPEVTVSALAFMGNDLYAAGVFTSAGQVAVSNIAKWDGTNWSALGSGLDSAVNALAVSGTDLYAAGFFSTAGGVPAKSVA